MRLKTILIVLSLILIISIPFVTKAHDDKGPGSVRVIRGLNYAAQSGAAAGSNSNSQALDLYLPTRASQATKAPMIIFIHGGAWLQGDKGEAQGLSLALAQLGFASASINYRLTQEAIYPAQIDDCRQAIRWLRNHADEYNLDPNKFGVWGISAGGHLAALLGTSGDTASAATAGPDLRLQAVCDWCGPSDLLTVSGQAGSRNKLDYDTAQGPVGKLLGGVPAEKKELAREASPVTYINSGDPPFLIMHGDIDDLVPFAQSEELESRLKAAKVPVEFVRLRGKEHNFMSEEEVRRVIDFFKQNLIDKKN
jgi:acetyl esterase/lipase